MTSRWQIKVVVPMVLLAGLVSLVTLSSSLVLAEGLMIPPTPTNEPRGGGGGGGEDRGPTPEPPNATVSGYVYDYSGAARQGGVTVMLDGGSWQLETATDSNGYYGFGGLGMGEAVLRLILPPEARPVTPEWPLSLGPGDDIIVNLGYYWGDDAPIPVILSSTLRGSTLTVQIKNRTIEAATGGLLEVTLPDGISASSQIFASQGTVEYRKGRVKVAVGDIPAGETVLVTASLSPKESAACRFGLAAPLPQPFGTPIQIVFNYDQQLTPQRILIDAGHIFAPQARAVPDRTSPQEVSAQADSGETAPVSTEQAPSEPEPLPEAPAEEGAVSSQEVPGASGPVSGDEVPAESGPASPPEIPAAPDSAREAEQPDGLPTSGGLQPTGLVSVVLPILLVMGLGVAGWLYRRPSE